MILSKTSEWQTEWAYYIIHILTTQTESELSEFGNCLSKQWRALNPPNSKTQTKVLSIQQIFLLLENSLMAHWNGCIAKVKIYTKFN